MCARGVDIQRAEVTFPRSPSWNGSAGTRARSSRNCLWSLMPAPLQPFQPCRRGGGQAVATPSHASSYRALLTFKERCFSHPEGSVVVLEEVKGCSLQRGCGGDLSPRSPSAFRRGRAPSAGRKRDSQGFPSRSWGGPLEGQGTHVNASYRAPGRNSGVHPALECSLSGMWGWATTLASVSL